MMTFAEFIREVEAELRLRLNKAAISIVKMRLGKLTQDDVYRIAETVALRHKCTPFPTPSDMMRYFLGCLRNAGECSVFAEDHPDEPEWMTEFYESEDDMK